MTTLTQVLQARQAHDCPRVRLTEGARSEIAAHTEAFLRRGGRIQEVPHGASAYNLSMETTKCGKTRYKDKNVVPLMVNFAKRDPKGVIQ